jgi:hypothetical protein
MNRHQLDDGADSCDSLDEFAFAHSDDESIADDYNDNGKTNTTKNVVAQRNMFSGEEDLDNVRAQLSEYCACVINKFVKLTSEILAQNQVVLQMLPFKTLVIEHL